MRISFLPSTVRITRAAIFFITAEASGMTHGGGYPALLLRKLLAVLPGSNIRTETCHNRHLSKADLQWGRGISELKHCSHPNTKAMHCFCSSSCRLKARHPHCGTWMLSWRVLSCLPPMACKRQDILLKTALLARLHVLLAFSGCPAFPQMPFGLRSELHEATSSEKWNPYLIF